MCVEFIWCLCIHKVSFRGSCYFFSSVHSYDGVSRLLSLVFKNILLRTYFMDSRKTDLDMPEPSADSLDLLSKSLYYLATTVTALLIFRGVEKEWRQLIQWTGVVFLVIELVALSMYFVLHPNSYNSASCILTLSARLVFVFFYLISLAIYCRQLFKDEEKEFDWKFQWEPKFLSGRSAFGFAGSLGFGENTNKWLEKELTSHHNTNPHSYAPPPTHSIAPHNLDRIDTTAGHYFNDKLRQELPRYEVCKNSSKK